jgi:hypothetical protein
LQYHEARAQVKKIKTLQEDNKRRAERRAELIAPVVGTCCPAAAAGTFHGYWSLLDLCLPNFFHAPPPPVAVDSSCKSGLVNTVYKSNYQTTRIRCGLLPSSYFFDQAPDPLQQLTVSGAPCKLFKGAEAHATNEAGANLQPWNGDSSNMIDR